MEQSSDATVIHDVPWALWLSGLFFAYVGSCFLLAASRQNESVLCAVAFGTVSVGIGLLMIARPSVLTIRADRVTGWLTLTYRSLLRKDVKEIPLHQIAAVDIQSSRGGRGGTTYRVVIVETNRHVTPLRSYYSGGYGAKERLAKRLRELTGVGGKGGKS